MNLILSLDEEVEIPVDDLLDFILSNKEMLESKYKTNYPKIICLYDYLNNGDNETSKYILNLKIDRK